GSAAQGVWCVLYWARFYFLTPHAYGCRSNSGQRLPIRGNPRRQVPLWPVRRRLHRGTPLERKMVLDFQDETRAARFSREPSRVTSNAGGLQRHASLACLPFGCRECPDLEGTRGNAASIAGGKAQKRTDEALRPRRLAWTPGPLPLMAAP